MRWWCAAIPFLTLTDTPVTRPGGEVVDRTPPLLVEDQVEALQHIIVHLTVVGGDSLWGWWGI